MTPIKIRYTWRRKSGEIYQEVWLLKDIDNHMMAKTGNISDELIERDLWTGWQDKNKVDIFCNDLISERGSDRLCQVIWQSHAGEWIMQSLGEGRGYRDMSYDYAQLHYEVKGNIHVAIGDLYKK